MKTTITSIFSLFALPLLAQVTIDQSSFPRPAGFVDNGVQAVSNGVALPTHGDNQTWDYGGLVSALPTTTVYYDASGDSDFPTALNHRDQQLSFQGFPIPASLYEAVDADGWYEQGRVLQESINSISFMTGGANDELNFPAQVQTYEGRLNLLDFPVQYEDTWTQSNIEYTQFELTVAAYSLNNTPGQQKRTNTHVRTVVGQGQLTIPDVNGNPSGALDAVLIKVERAVLDSFFLGGQLAPAPLLNTFGLTQGSIFEEEYYVFYVPGYITTALNINLDEQGAVSTVFYRPGAAELSTSIGDDLSFNAMKMYPNPVAAGDVMNVELQDKTDATTIELFDMTGRQVFSTPVSTSSGVARVALPTNLSVGMYNMVVRSVDTSVLSVSKLMVK
ncbi:MAG: T9SS type A sorting domain-containing protein [Flavobacteriales bacterium]|nr:T9SS type A sorting domain-containing protein [Flavobacteriales bacterium]